MSAARHRALAANLVATVALTAVLPAMDAGDSADETAADDYAELEPVAGVQPLPPTPEYEHVGRPSGA